MDIINLCLFLILGFILMVQYASLKKYDNKILWGKFSPRLKNFSYCTITCSFIFGIYIVYYLVSEIDKKEKYKEYENNIKIGILLFVGGAILWPISLSKDIIFYRKFQVISLLMTAIGANYILARTIQITEDDRNDCDISAIAGLSFLSFQTTIMDLILWNYYQQM